jgi:hypothetical protein
MLRGRFRDNIFTLLILTIANIIIFYTIFSSINIFGGSITNEEGLSYDNMLDRVINEINELHPEISEYLVLNNNWKRIDHELKTDYTNITYSKDHWTISIYNNKKLENFYEIEAKHGAGIYWKGNIKEDEIIEEKYEEEISNGPDEQIKDIRTLVMIYLKENYTELDSLIDDPDNMEWLLVSSNVLEGYSQFTYSNNGWNITIGHTISPQSKDIYEVIVIHKTEDIKWIGLVDNGQVKEIKDK